MKSPSGAAVRSVYNGLGKLVPAPRPRIREIINGRVVSVVRAPSGKLVPAAPRPRVVARTPSGGIVPGSVKVYNSQGKLVPAPRARVGTKKMPSGQTLSLVRNPNGIVVAAPRRKRIDTLMPNGVIKGGTVKVYNSAGKLVPAPRTRIQVRQPNGQTVAMVQNPSGQLSPAVKRTRVKVPTLVGVVAKDKTMTYNSRGKLVPQPSGKRTASGGGAVRTARPTRSVFGAATPAATRGKAKGGPPVAKNIWQDVAPTAKGKAGGRGRGAPTVSVASATGKTAAPPTDSTPSSKGSSPKGGKPSAAGKTGKAGPKAGPKAALKASPSLPPSPKLSVGQTQSQFPTVEPEEESPAPTSEQLAQANLQAKRANAKEGLPLIAGGAVGGLALLALAIFAFVRCRHMQSKKSGGDDFTGGDDVSPGGDDFSRGSAGFIECLYDKKGRHSGSFVMHGQARQSLSDDGRKRLSFARPQSTVVTGGRQSIVQSPSGGASRQSLGASGDKRFSFSPKPRVLPAPNSLNML